jgi:hypothetical protein
VINKNNRFNGMRPRPWGISRNQLPVWAFGAAVFVLLGFAPTGAAETAEFNHRATATAQLLAGIRPVPGDPAIDRLIASEAWDEHQKWMADQWGEAKIRLLAMAKWRAQELSISHPQRRTLLYPFSGPDFLNAYALFPNHQRYVFFSLERPGGLPDLESVTSHQFVKLLHDVRNAFRDIFQRNYFITDYMTKQLTTPWIRGTVPVMATMMALMGQRIVRIEPIELFPDLSRAYEARDAKRPRRIMRGVRIDFVDGESGAPHQLYYFSVDATDKALAFYPGFLDWVGQNQPATALIKSASYLLHDNQFAKTRTTILSAADFVIEDDTGIPYRYFKRSHWHVRLFGQYHKPIKGLGFGYQADLEAAYKANPNLAPLPFPFGYHWRGQKSGLLVADR